MNHCWLVVHTVILSLGVFPFKLHVMALVADSLQFTWHYCCWLLLVDKQHSRIVVKRLVAFLMAVACILVAFALMFAIIYQEEELCSAKTLQQAECEDAFPHCSIDRSLLKVREVSFMSFPRKFISKK